MNVVLSLCLNVHVAHVNVNAQEPIYYVLRSLCDGGASLNRVFNGPWGSNWFALGGSSFQFVQGVPPKKCHFGSQNYVFVG